MTHPESSKKKETPHSEDTVDLPEELIRQRVCELWKIHQENNLKARSPKTLKAEDSPFNNPLKLLIQSFLWIEKHSAFWQTIGTILIPVALWYLTQSYQQSQEKIAQDQQQSQAALEKIRRQQQAIDEYLNQISTILLSKDLKQDENLRKLTQAKTLNLLRNPDLDGIGKGQVINFLSEMQLVQGKISVKTLDRRSERVEVKNLEPPVIFLRRANLNKAELQYITLYAAILQRADLAHANLTSASLSGANLAIANLEGANLESARLVNANLLFAKLTNATLSQADLTSTILRFANLQGADFKDAILLKTDLCGADLRGAKNLNVKQIKQANAWESAKYDENLRQQLGIPANPDSNYRVKHLCAIPVPAPNNVWGQVDLTAQPLDQNSQ